MLQQVQARRIISLSLGATRKFELRLNWPEAGVKPRLTINHTDRSFVFWHAGTINAVRL